MRVPLVVAEDVSVAYGAFVALQEVSLTLQSGEILGIAGPNGAGKTTLLKALAGILRIAKGEISYDGTVVADGADRRQCKGVRWMVRHGVTIVPEGRRLFGELTVEDNLRFGSVVARSAREQELLNRVYDLFPRLFERHSQPAATLSGGEQQMVAIGRALMSEPSTLLVDEMSLGLAPVLIAQVTDALRRLREDTALSLILVEENLGALAALADRVMFIKAGRLVAEQDITTLDIVEASRIYLS